MGDKFIIILFKVVKENFNKVGFNYETEWCKWNFNPLMSSNTLKNMNF